MLYRRNGNDSRAEFLCFYRSFFQYKQFSQAD